MPLQTKMKGESAVSTELHKCSTCKKRKPRSEFYFDRTKRDGVRSSCKPCVNKANAKWKRDNSYRYKDDPKKLYARDKTRRLVRRGILKKPEHCQLCGEKPRPAIDGRETLQAHHPKGYEDSKDITWACSKCHSLLHEKPRVFPCDCRELLSCGHPKACLVDVTPANSRIFRGDGVEERFVKCSACVEREKVREMCAKNLERNAEHLEMLTRTEDNQEVGPTLIQGWKDNAHSLRLQADAIRQLDLTKDLAPSSTEAGER